MTSMEKMLVIIKAQVLLFGLIGIFMGGQVLLERLDLFSRTVATVWAYGFVVGIFVACAVLVWSFWYAFGDRAYRQARAAGLPAQARVLDIQMTRVRLRRRQRLMPEREYIMRVAVAPAAAAEYEARVVQFLDPRLAPRKGATVAVKVHPGRPEIVVWDGETGEG